MSIGAISDRIYQNKYAHMLIDMMEKHNSRRKRSSLALPRQRRPSQCKADNGEEVSIASSHMLQNIYIEVLLSFSNISKKSKKKCCNSWAASYLVSNTG